MSNNNNNASSSQDFSSSHERQRILAILDKCKEEELLALEYVAKRKGLGVGVKDVVQNLKFSTSTATSVLRRLREPGYDSRIDIPLLRRTTGRRGANLHILKENLLLEDIQSIMNKNGYSLKAYLMAIGEEYQENFQTQTNLTDKKNDVSEYNENYVPTEKDFRMDCQNSTEEILEEVIEAASDVSSITNNSQFAEVNNIAELLDKFKTNVVAEIDDRFAELEKHLSSRNNLSQSRESV
jgi:hypothetical protein